MSGSDSPPMNIDSSTPDVIPRSIFVPTSDPRKDLRETVDSILSDKFMAALSVLLVPIIILPLVVALPASVLTFFDICDFTIVVFFVVEYVSKLYLAQNRWEFFTSPWHLLDLAVVVLSFISYLPLVALNGRGSTALLVRLLRLPRALAVSGRAAGRREKETVQQVQVKPPETIIRQVGPDLVTEHDNLSWEDLERHLRTTEQEWIDIHNIDEAGILKLSRLLKVSSQNFRVKQVDELYPRVEFVQKMSFIFLQSGEIKYPEHAESYFTIARRGEIIVCSGPKIVTASPHGIDMFQRSLGDMRSHIGEHSFTVSVLYGILDTTLKEYRSMFSEIELEVTRIGSTSRSKLPKDFLQRMYELNKVVVRLVTNLVHFRQLIGVLVSKKVSLEGFDENSERDFEALQEETSYLSEIANDIVDHLKTIIDLYINQSSYETNRILKILAVITSLSVIPAAIGGILGMNLLDVPYSFELWQVVLVILISMAFVGYCFYKLGWLKS
jgi:Mg2+ and Co2+ transporter CorA